MTLRQNAAKYYFTHLQTPIYHRGVPKKAIYFGCIQEEIFNSSQQKYIFKYFQNSGSIAYLRFITSTHTFKGNLSVTELRYNMNLQGWVKKLQDLKVSFAMICTFVKSWTASFNSCRCSKWVAIVSSCSCCCCCCCGCVARWAAMMSMSAASSTPEVVE